MPLPSHPVVSRIMTDVLVNRACEALEALMPWKKKPARYGHLYQPRASDFTPEIVRDGYGAACASDTIPRALANQTRRALYRRSFSTETPENCKKFRTLPLIGSPVTPRNASPP